MPEDIYFSELHRRHLYDGMQEGICSGEELLLRGPAGGIEVLTSCPDCHTQDRPLAIICHPHPLYGGSLKNKVVHILAESFNALGMLSVTFNFRGVGRSGGRFDHGIGEQQDLLAVVDYFRQRYPRAPLWLAGFSFGAYVALHAHAKAAAARLLLVAPPVGMFDFNAAPVVKVPWMVVQGGRDEVVSPQAVSTWVMQQPQRPDYRWMADADHFFHGRLNRLRDSVLARWRSAVVPPPANDPAVVVAT